MKNTFNKKDVEMFDELLTKAELTGMSNYRRNIGRLKLDKWLTGFTQKAKDAMWLIVKDM